MVGHQILLEFHGEMSLTNVRGTRPDEELFRLELAFTDLDVRVQPLRNLVVVITFREKGHVDARPGKDSKASLLNDLVGLIVLDLALVHVNVARSEVVEFV